MKYATSRRRRPRPPPLAWRLRSERPLIRIVRVAAAVMAVLAGVSLVDAIDGRPRRGRSRVRPARAALGWLVYPAHGQHAGKWRHR